MLMVRPLAAGDFSAVLRINAANGPAVARLDPGELRRLAALSGLHRVAADNERGVLGYLLAFASSAAYDGEEFQHFKAHFAQPFLYVDQLAIAAAGRRQGLGRLLYQALADHARTARCERICCEVNAQPPNPDSMAFHQRLGFEQVGSMSVGDGRSVALLARATADFISSG